jgi:ATP-dependent Lon protease
MPRPPNRRPTAKKTKQSHHSDSDSSVDERGNIRNLIDYDYDDEDSMTDCETSTSDESMVPKRRVVPKRKAAVKAAERIRRTSIPSSEEDEEPRAKPRVKAKPKAEPKAKAKAKAEPKANAKVNTNKMDEEDAEPRKERRRPKNVIVEDEESESSASDDDSEDSEEAETTDSDEDSDEDEETGPFVGLRISGLGMQMDPNKPKKHNMKEQPAIVKRFVKLVQKGNDSEENASHIDHDITYFKKLPQPKQNLIIEKMERKFSMDDDQVPLKFRILEKQVPPHVEKVAMGKYNAMTNIDPSTTEYYKAFHWIEGYSNLPLGVYKDLPVKLEDGPEACAGFVTKVRDYMDSAIFGHDEPKLQILQFVSSWIANPTGAGNVLSIHGPMGVGKTTLVKEGVAKALGRPFHFISLGGATDSAYLDGHSYTYEGSTWGRIVDILMQAKCMNPIIYFDELDKVSDTPKGEEIMNLLIHITDGSQNDKFQDKYFSGIDIDLSRCLFIFSHNNHERVNPILRDRMYNIKVSGFNLKEKLVIAEQYLLSGAMKNVGLHEKVSISKEIVEYIIENHTGEEKGVRELKRCMETVMSKLNLLRFYNDPKLVPFAIPNFALPFTLKKEHISLFLKKKEGIDPSIAHIYT